MNHLISHQNIKPKIEEKANMTSSDKKAVLDDQKTPLVSVRIHNYNYGRYLRECIDSILNQTYSNIEICFSDNGSSDNSWPIALEYQRQYPDIINIACNRSNFGPDANIVNCVYPSRGKYTVQMCSDDTMAPGFVEKCVKTLEKHHECAFVMVHRAIIDENGNLTNESPFYNKSCIINGAEQAAVYMMGAINPSISQVMYVSNREAANRVDFSKVLAGRWYGARIMDFSLSCNYPIAYIKEPLLQHRLHGANDSQEAAGNLIEIIGPFLLNYQFAEIASSYNLSKVVKRLPKATDKLSQLCLRYCVRFLIEGNETIGEQYYHLAAALSLNIKFDKTFDKITDYWASDEREKKNIIKDLEKEVNLVTRKISYDPPPGSIEIQLN